MKRFGGWWMVIVLLILNIVSLVDRSILNLLVTPIQRELSLSDVQIGLLLGPAFAISYLVCGLPFGWATDRFPRRWVIFTGSTIWSAAMIGGGLARGFGGLVASRAFVGGGEAAISPTAFSLIGDGVPRARMTTAMAIYSTGPKLAQATAFLLGGWLIAYAAVNSMHIPLLGELTSWRLVLVLLGIPGMLLSLLVFSFREPARRGQGAQKATGGTTLIPLLKAQWQLVSLLMGGAAAAGLMYTTMLAWYPTFMVRHFHWEAPRFGPVLFWVGVVGAASVIVKGMIVDRLAKRGMTDAPLRFYTWLIAIAIPAGIVAFAVPNPYVSMMGFGLADLVSSAVPMYIAATIQIYFPPQFRGQLTALLFLLITIVGAGLGPLSAAFLTDHVFRDPAAIGHSLLIVTVSASIVSLVCLRLALRRLPTVAPVYEAQAAA